MSEPGSDPSLSLSLMSGPRNASTQDGQNGMCGPLAWERLLASQVPHCVEQSFSAGRGAMETQERCGVTPGTGARATV